MAPLAAALPIAGKALSFLPTIYQGITALNQNKLGKELKKSNYIPSGVRESVNIARSNANATTLPGQDRMEENLEKQTSNTVSAAQRTGGDSTSVVDTVQKADLASKNVTGDFGKMLAEFKFENSKALGSALERKGAYEQNNQEKYEAGKSALRGSSMQNFFNFLNNAASGVQMLGKGESSDPGSGSGQSSIPPNSYQISPNDSPEIRQQKMRLFQEFMKAGLPDPTKSLVTN